MTKRVPLAFFADSLEEARTQAEDWANNEPKCLSFHICQITAGPSRLWNVQMDVEWEHGLVVSPPFPTLWDGESA